MKKLQTQLTFMGQRLIYFARKLPNPFSLTPVNIIILKKNCKSHLRSSIIHVSTSRWWWGYQIFQQQPALIICASTTSNMVRRKWFWLTYLLSSKQHNNIAQLDRNLFEVVSGFLIFQEICSTLSIIYLKSLQNTKLVMWPIT